MSDLLNKASLVVIPSGYKEDTVYSVVPSDGSGDLSFTRASNGTRINSAGLVEVCPWNLLSDSENFSSWSLEGGTLTSGQTDPNGGTTAYKYVQIPGGGLYSGGVVTADVKFAQVWIKSVSGGAITVNISDGAAFFGTFNVTGTWQLFTAPYTANSRNGIYLYAISNASGIYVWRPQLNIGATAKPYFPVSDSLNVPRLTYQNGGGGCPSLLLEKQSTNLALYSEDFASWTQANITVTANNTTSPDGTQNADKIEASGSGSVSHSVRQFISTTSGAVYALSLYAKKGTTDWIMIRHDNGGTLNYFNLNTGVKGTADASATITSVGNGWYRIVVYHTGTGSNGPEIYIATSDGGNEFTANGQNLYIWGAQYEASSYATSYIGPTTSASATRVADACSKTGISSLIGQTSGVLFVDFVYLGGVQAIVMELANSAANDLINVYITSSATTQCYMFDGGSQVGFINSSHTFVQGSRYKIAIGYASNDLVLYINGTQIGTATPSSIAATSEIYISRDKAALYLTDTKYNEVVIFPTRLTNAELASLTTI